LPVNEREELVAASLALLGIETFTNLMRSVRNDTPCLAVASANSLLDEGRTVQQLFFTGEADGFMLRVDEVSKNQFNVELSYITGSEAGDGASWGVLLDRAGSIVRATPTGFWIA
jgi:hypothetical protein